MSQLRSRSPRTVFGQAVSPLLAALALSACGADGTATAGAGSCPQDHTPIHRIQGSDWTSPLVGEDVTVQGIVTAITADGLFIQSTEPDEDPSTSEGLFLLTDSRPGDLKPGMQLSARGQVAELGERQDTQTALSAVRDLRPCGIPMARPLERIALPLQARDRESLESMRVQLQGDLYVTDVYNLQRGDFSVAVDGILPIPTEVARPGDEANDVASDNRKRLLRVRLQPGAEDRFALGDQWQPDAGVLGHDGRDQRLLLEEPARIVPAFDWGIPERAPNDIRVVSLNLLNYFNGDGQGGDFPTPRGAETPDAFDAQRARLRGAVQALDPQLLAVQELENDGFGDHSAAADFLEDLAAATGHEWAAAAPGTGPIGTDQITVALFYRPDVLEATGSARSPDAAAFDLLSRLPVGQVFTHTASGERFLVSSNHFKSKGSCPDEGSNRNQNDGQGCWNPARLAAAKALTAWMSPLAAAEAEGRALILGDLNAYRMEDPVQQLLIDDYSDLTATVGEAFNYSYVFFGAAGTLDHAFATSQLQRHVVDARILNINAGQPRGMRLEPPWLRSSDHDPVLVDLRFTQSATSD